MNPRVYTPACEQQTLHHNKNKNKKCSAALFVVPSDLDALSAMYSVSVCGKGIVLHAKRSVYSDVKYKPELHLKNQGSILAPYYCYVRDYNRSKNRSYSTVKSVCPRICDVSSILEISMGHDHVVDGMITNKQNKNSRDPDPREMSEHAQKMLPYFSPGLRHSALLTAIQSSFFGAHSLGHEGGSNSSYPGLLQPVPESV